MARKKHSPQAKSHSQLPVPTPSTRSLHVYAIDPSSGRYSGNQVTVRVPWEPLKPEPGGQTQAHADHGQGLKKILSDFGTVRFWYSRPASQPAFFADLLRYSRRSARVGQYDLVDTDKILPFFGAVSMQALWPLPGTVLSNENNNSVVLLLTLGNVSFVPTGDAEADGVWTHIAGQIPPNTRFFVPYHGSDNGTFTSLRNTRWLNSLTPSATVAISSHVQPCNHPDSTVIAALSVYSPTYRTDQHYHVTVETDGNNVKVTYSHV
jgi:competence protein ComEC